MLKIKKISFETDIYFNYKNINGFFNKTVLKLLLKQL